jgi:transcription initiation factor IIF auxiliary subunit
MPNEIEFNEYSMWTQKKHDEDWFDWCVYVGGEARVIDSIESVEYTLHPTFPNPIRLTKNKLDRFALFSAGWGGFLIRIAITLEDGSAVNAGYSLKLLQNNWPKKAPPKDFPDADTRSVYEALMHEKYRWRKIETIVKQANITNERVLEILDNLEEENLGRKAYFQSVDNKDLWGATAVVGISPRVSGM